MLKKTGSPTVFILVLMMIIRTLSCTVTDESRKVHIVYMGLLPEGKYSPSSHHLSILQRVIHTSSVENSLVRSYKRSFSGFAANLTSHERRKLETMKEVVSIFPSTTLQLQTTRSWDFMGFHETVKRKPSLESDLVVGVIDSGVWPESESFSDRGFGAPPKKWKGVCEGGQNFTCNNKVIGARYYSSTTYGPISARDDMGHGSHTASIAAGNRVNGASFYGLAEDVLAAFDDAIADGVDIISVSLSGDSTAALEQDVISIGSFHAMVKGILTVQSAGNDGCFSGSGRSINSFTLNETKFPLVYGRDVSRHCSEFDAQSCMAGCVDSDLVKGKIVLCYRLEGVAEAYKAGAVGAVVRNTVSNNASFVVPSLHQLLATQTFYCNSRLTVTFFDRDSRVEIFKSEAIKDFTSPTVASFSSCGPLSLAPEIMKPDVTAPGIEILAAYSPIASPSDGPLDTRQVKYNIISGTSMSCPHVAGVATDVKSFHLEWSPSAIKSAIMTTAWPMDTSKNPAGEFSYGSGHINPVKAITPGLVYGAGKEDYIRLLCSLGFASNAVQVISGDNSTCLTNDFAKTLPIDFNYPAMSFLASPMSAFLFKFNRTVTNVGFSNSTYRAKAMPSPIITVKVQPTVLSFKSSYEKKSFVVTVEGGGMPHGTMASVTVVWSDGTHSVRSPVAVASINTDDV
ncbi:hypothetical protein SADUNF_Sadunf19G0064300 [Salix dunnii]|uniref:Uncharacterized protein n=1 Tax=Salix dunnii TaxID=1413687 RepID=A0A835J1M1_9ROSI|nr:hypothetical protein SADUNF_Sadunf19G0064300 [Salix dunnii]